MTLIILITLRVLKRNMLIKTYVDKAKESVQNEIKASILFWVSC